VLNIHDELIADLSRSLTEKRYNPVAAQNNVLYASEFLIYLSEIDLPIEVVTPSHVDQYIRYATECFEAKYGRYPSPRWDRLPRTAICKILSLAQGQWPPQSEVAEESAKLHGDLANGYRRWMEDERGFTDQTVRGNMWEARTFLKWQLDRGSDNSVLSLSVSDIDAYMDMRSSNMSRKSISGIAARLRSLLRYLYQARLVLTDLAPLVIGPSIYAYEGVPSIIDSTQIRAVLEETAKDKSPRGLRDYAILQILATYGLRDREIVRISIDDLDWRAATLRVSHRKTGTFSILPLSDAVGEALIEYLRHGRPQVESRNIFVLALAPYTPMTTVYNVASRRLAAAGVHLPGRRGPHVFRHARATELLRASVPQKIIGDLLGHRSVESSNTYLKLATEDLRGVALEVPGSGVRS